jgi:hypothetical protein
MLADHHRVEARFLGLARPVDELRQIPPVHQGPVLAEDEQHPWLDMH